MDLSNLNPDDRRRLAALARSARKTEEGMKAWELMARPKQLPPDHIRHHHPWVDPVEGNIHKCEDRNKFCTKRNPEWTHWIMIAGRGSGKTWAGSGWVVKMAITDPGCRVCVLAPTYAQVRENCFEGSSGILKCAQDWGVETRYNKNNMKIEFDNGSVVQGYSAENSDMIRGGNFTYAWCDELCLYEDPRTYTAHLRPALRLRRGDGGPSRMIITTSPMQTFLIRYFMQKVAAEPKHYHLTHSTTRENKAGLSQEAVDEMYDILRGKSDLKQELEGELVESDDALFRATDFDKYRIPATASLPEFTEVVVGVDPATTSKARSDETGIVVVGAGVDKHSYVLEDASLRGTPIEVMNAIERVYYMYDAGLIVVENNAAGDYFRSLLELKNAIIPCREVHAMKGKFIRAEPYGYLNQAGRIHMVGVHEKLEEQLCSMVPYMARDKQGDDRADAFIWAMKWIVKTEGGDWGRAFGFIKCESCQEKVNWIKDKVCANCGTPVVKEKRNTVREEKEATRWSHAYKKECPKGHKYQMNLKQCPECNPDPSAYMAQVAALTSGQQPGRMGYSGRNWLAGRSI